MNDVFFNEYGRLRSGWRAAVFVLAFVLLESGWVVLASALSYAGIITTDLENLIFWSADIFITFVVALIVGWACGKVLEGLPLRAFGWAFYRGWIRDLILGFLIGALTLAFACLIGILSGQMSFALNGRDEPSAIGFTLLISAAMFIFGAAAEETLFRGYLLQTFARAKLAWVAIVFTSIFFAAAHLGNPNASLLAAVDTLLAGLWFSVLYLKTRSLWLPFAAHFAWNWFQGAIFGIPVSGITRITSAPLLLQTDSGPAWLTGGSYGIEGGIASTIALLLSTAFIWFLPLLKADEEMLELTSRENSDRGQ